MSVSVLVRTIPSLNDWISNSTLIRLCSTALPSKERVRLERTRRLFADHYRRFCIRNILKDWFGTRATDDFIWEVCNSIILDDDQQVYGYDALPRPKLYPRKHREFLRALVSVVLGIGIRKVSLRDLDAAYSIAFPKSTPINVNKKRSQPLPNPPLKGGN